MVSDAALLHSVLDQMGGGPQSQSRLAVLPHHVQMLVGDGICLFSSLGNDVSDSLVELVVQHGQFCLACGHLGDGRHAKHVLQQCRLCIPAYPQEHDLAVVNEEQTMADQMLATEVCAGRHDNLAGLGVRQTSFIGHEDEVVKVGINVLDQVLVGQGRQETQGRRPQIRGDLRGLSETNVLDQSVHQQRQHSQVGAELQGAEAPTLVVIKSFL